MKDELNNVVLTTEISRALSNLQDGGADVCCNTIDRTIGLILDLKVENDVSSDDVLSVISDLRIVTAMIKDLIPKCKEGGAQ